ncbi:VanZ family protein [Pseudobacteroides cellulosolvens]|uniref:VanZ family protein n=1 Tax=Pseudobacteroides cellulosolvens ATCC 35603 = DSM 2933 TaxID=398512 RepID=A0A0L6JXD1_9FIRM|nr:VanZ family protein [Pseudobacteroides cellulosolvens]KNY30518.1 VanZ family protein [Pseudobacteroides cellulosolvens ATCC 35603 = DSM 2933]
MVEGFHISSKYFIICMLALWLIIRFIVLFRKKIKNKQIYIAKEIVINSFAMYIIFLTGITLFPVTIYWIKQKYYISPYVEYTPFKHIFESIDNGVPVRFIAKNLIGNIFLTTPIGLFLPLIWRNKFKTFRSILLFGIIISFSIEVLQYIEGIVFPSIYTRASDINDIILNTIGTLLGYFVFNNLFKRKLEKNITL